MNLVDRANLLLEAERDHRTIPHDLGLIGYLAKAVIEANTIFRTISCDEPCSIWIEEIDAWISRYAGEEKKDG